MRSPKELDGNQSTQDASDHCADVIGIQGNQFLEQVQAEDRAYETDSCGD